MPLDRSVIASFPPFADFTPEALDGFLGDGRVQPFARNAHVFKQGAEAKNFFLLVEGWVRAYRVSASGEQVVARYVGPGELFGIAPAIGSGTYPGSAVAVIDSVVMAWPASHWPALAARYPSLKDQMMRTLGERLQETQTRLAEISTQEVERRVANALLRLAAQGGREDAGGVAFDFPISRQDVAEMTGTTLFTVSRVFKAWEANGVVSIGRRRIVIRDPRRLAAIAAKG